MGWPVDPEVNKVNKSLLPKQCLILNFLVAALLLMSSKKEYLRFGPNVFFEYFFKKIFLGNLEINKSGLNTNSISYSNLFEIFKYYRKMNS